MAGPGAMLPVLALSLAGCATMAGQPGPVYPAVDVQASGETVPVGTGGAADAADDPAIWRNAANPAASLIVGTDKKAGLYVYGLDGRVRDYNAAGLLNNVDLREVAPGRILVAASDRTDRAVPKIALFLLDGQTGKLTPLGAQAFLPAGHAPAEAYGFCMGKGLAEGELARAYVVLKDGEVAESRLIDADGALRAQYVRSVRFATQSEGCVVDDRTGTLFVAEEDVGIWKVDLKAPTLAAEAFAMVGADKGLAADVEGLALAPDGASGGYLVASSQGDNAYVLLDLGTGALKGRFRIAAGRFGATSETDGIELALGDFGPDFPAGLFVAQDGDNAPAAQNFKLVRWDEVLDRISRK
ncbi:phytase [Novosphingobium sp.]|uniref:phytase n=2 Tax=Novosphingobium TaxID=165696 RepID=UPI00258C7342|nr:phytase [Novosphingobium sp.]